MNKSFAFLVFLLFVLPSHQMLGQVAPPKGQPLRTSNQNAAPVSTEPSTAKSLYEDGVKRVEMGQVSEAVERFQHAVALDPEYAEAYSALGRAFFKLRQWDNASNNLRRAIALKAKQRPPQNPLPYPSTPPSGTKPPTPNKNANDAKTPGAISLATTTRRSANEGAAEAPKEKPADLTMARSVSRPAFSETRIAAVVSKQEPADLPMARSVSLPAFSETRIAAVVPRQEPADLPMARSVSLPAFSETRIAAVVPRQEPANLPIAMSVAPPASGETNIAEPVSLKSTSNELSLTNTYRVGPKDVLYIRLNSSQPSQSPVFMVTPSGLIEHPKLPEPLPVLGLTVEEIAAKFEQDLKTRALLENPKVSVEVFEYASHAIVISGLVKTPGTKMLKSEATPLLVVLAEAEPLPGAGRVTVVRNETQTYEADLETTDINLLVQPGDVVTVHRHTTQFIYVEGRVRFPGEKTYRHRLTLLQAIMAAGGEPTKSQVAEISRDDGKGSVVRTRVDLKAIEAGEAEDPVLKPGDRIMVLP